MFKQRSDKKELMDDLTLHSETLGQNLRELRMVNFYLGGNLVLWLALNKLKRKGYFQENRIYQVADIGSGGGDNLVLMAKWFRKNEIEVVLTGIDANAYMIEFGQAFCKDYSNIRFEQHNVFDEKIGNLSFDITTCSLFCHHFTNDELKAIFKNIKTITQGFFIINDLHRHPIAWGGIWFLTRILNGSYLIKNDAPLSVLRAFKKNELKVLVNQVFEKVSIRWIWAFRWLIIANGK